MLIPVIGMILGLLTAVFVTYRKPREYVVTTAEPTTAEIEQHIANIKPIQITASAVAIVATLPPSFHKLYNYWWFSRFNHFRGIRYLQTQRK